MPKLRARLLLTTSALLTLAALSNAAGTARAQEARPANAPAAASKPENANDAVGERETSPARVANPEGVRADTAFFTKPGRDADDTRRLFPSADTLTARVAAARSQSSDAPSAARPDDSVTTPQSQPSPSPSPSPEYTPLTGEEKMGRAAKNAFLSPGGYARVAFSSIWTQWHEDSQPHKTTEDEVADGASRFAINFGRRATRSLLGGGVFPVLFRQDPRYERAEEGTGAAARAGWAVSRVFVTRGDNGRHQPNVSNWAGSLSSSAISNLWERSTPGHDRIGTDATFRRFAKNFLWDAVNNLVREFWPDIKGVFGK